MCDAQTQEGRSRPREPAPRASLRRKLSTASNYPLLRLLVIKPCDDGGRWLVRRFSTILYPVGLIRLLQDVGRVPATARASVFSGHPTPGLTRGSLFRATPTCFSQGAWIIAGVGESRWQGFPQRQPRRRGGNGRHERTPKHQSPSRPARRSAVIEVGQLNAHFARGPARGLSFSPSALNVPGNDVCYADDL